MADKVIILPPTATVKEASITVSFFKLASAVSTEEKLLTDVDCVSIRGRMLYRTVNGKRHGWEGHDIAKLVAAYPDNPDVQAIVPLWEQWGKHSTVPHTLSEKAAIEAAAGVKDPLTALKDANVEKTDLAKTVDTYVEPIDAASLEQVKFVFGIEAKDGVVTGADDALLG